MWRIIFNSCLSLEDFKKMSKDEYDETLIAWELELEARNAEMQRQMDKIQQ